MSDFNDLSSVVQGDDVVAISCDLYIKTPSALDRILAELRTIGYAVKDLRLEENYRTAALDMEKDGWSLWFASLSDIRHGKCKSCGQYIAVAGIAMHGHTCEKCGAVTYYHIIDGSDVRFEFIDERYRHIMFPPQLRMKARRWAVDEGYLYLYPEALSGGGLGVVTGEKAEAYLKDHQDKWAVVTEGGLSLLKVRYPLERSDESVINTMDIWGHMRNYEIVNLWQGKEYSEYARLPIPQYISIYETWHWAPLAPSPSLHNKIILAAGMTPDQGYYYQDGRAAFYPEHWQRMATFIRHFTTLDADRFDKAWSRFRHDGPGAIEDLALFCHEDPQITNKPNMFNTLSTLVDGMAGKKLSSRQIEQAQRGAADPMMKKFLFPDEED